VIVCPKCDRVVSLDDNVYREKVVSHQLWYHPSDEDVRQCYQDVEDTLYQVGVLSASGNTEYAALYSADLVDLVMRLRRYMEIKNEQSV
jgi:hypothetical protein